MPSYTPQLQSEYQRLFDTCIINSEKYPLVDSQMKKILNGQTRYQLVAEELNIPWYFIGIVHSLEGGGNFTTHLHNGDPLTARTSHVPANRPQTGTPPFTWEFSAKDALRLQKLDIWPDWSVPGILYRLEGYNGYGYRSSKVNINSPYLWSFSNHYTKGKFASDGHYSPTLVSKQCGAAVILRRMVEKQIVIPGVTDRLALIRQLGQMVTFAPSRYVAKAEELQLLLNLAGAHIKVDGKAGRMTSDAYFSFTESYLADDPEHS